MTIPTYVVRVHGIRNNDRPFNGSGFLLNNKGHVVTCRHVIEDSTEIRVSLPYTAAWPYEKLFEIPQHDIAIIRSVVPVSAETPFASIDYEWQSRIKEQDEVTVWGHSGVDHYDAAQGISCKVTFSQKHGRIGLIGNLNPGDSGGPVVDSTNQVIGIAQVREQKRDGHAMAIPISLMVLNTDGVLPDLQKEVGPLTSFRSSAISQLETTDGAVRLSSHFYVDRQADIYAKRLLQRIGLTLRIKGPSKTGKSSLLARLVSYARDTGRETLYIDFQLFDNSHFSSLDKLLRHIANLLASRLHTINSPQQFWDRELGSKDNLSDFIASTILDGRNIPFTLLLDNVDQVFAFADYRDDFFSLIRSWHSRRAFETEWEQLNIILAYSTEAFLFIHDLNQSPFNVGEQLELSDFTFDQVATLNKAHPSPLNDVDLRSIFSLVGGHPYLVRGAMYLLATGMRLSELLERASAADGPFAEHLHRLMYYLNSQPQLRTALQAVLVKGHCDDPHAFYQLRAGGLIHGVDNRDAKARCELYNQYFARQL